MRARDLVPVALLLPLVGFVVAMVRTTPARTPSADPAASSDAPLTAAEIERRRETVRTLVAAEGAGTYAAAMIATEGRVDRWPDDTDTLRVYIEPAAHLEGWRQRRLADAQLAFRGWEPLLPFSITFVGSAGEADVTVAWNERFARGGQVGNTHSTSDDRGRLRRAVVTLAVRDNDGEVIPDELAAVTALHEAGHALGLTHSPNASDLMAARYTGTVRGLTRADTATMSLWYRLPGGVM